MYGASNITITGNYFHDNEDGITNYDSGSGPYTVTNNVLVGPFYSGAAGIMITSCNGCIASHNTIVNAVNASFGCGPGHGGPNSTNITSFANVVDGGYCHRGHHLQFTATYNLNSGRQRHRQHQRHAGIRLQSGLRLLPLPTRAVLSGLPRCKRRQEHGHLTLGARKTDLDRCQGPPVSDRSRVSKLV